METILHTMTIIYTVSLCLFQALVVPEKFQHILRLLNTNIDGKEKCLFAFTAIKVKMVMEMFNASSELTMLNMDLQLIIIVQGVGRRYATLVCRKADVDLNKRAGELTEDEVERISTILQNPRQYKIPDWFLNRKKDIKDGKYSQV